MGTNKKNFGLFIAIKLPLMSTGERNELLESFIAEAIEMNDCQFGGGGIGEYWSGFVEPDDPSKSISDDIRQEIENWLSGQSSLMGYYVSEPFDLEHGEIARHYAALNWSEDRQDWVH